MARVPAYSIVYQTIKTRIKEGRYLEGSLLPTEGELEEEFGVSRTTIRKATSMLTSENYIRVVQGKGSEVLSPFNVQQLNNVSSITETLTRRGYEVSTKRMYIELIRIPKYVANELELPVDTLIYKVERIQCIDNKPIAIMMNYIRQDVAPGLEQHRGEFVSLYGFLESQYHVVFREAKEYLTAKVADFMEASVLEVPYGTPLLCSKRITKGNCGLFEYSMTKILADKYEYCVYLKGR